MSSRMTLTTDEFAREAELAWMRARPGRQATDRDELLRALRRLLEPRPAATAVRSREERRLVRPGLGSPSTPHALYPPFLARSRARMASSSDASKHGTQPRRDASQVLP
jgi:hypothetical protein